MDCTGSIQRQTKQRQYSSPGCIGFTKKKSNITAKIMEVQTKMKVQHSSANRAWNTALDNNSGFNKEISSYRCSYHYRQKEPSKSKSKVLGKKTNHL